MEKSKSYQCALVHKELYDALDKDEDPPAGSDQGLEKLKTSKDVEPPKGPKSNESKSSSSKCTKFHPKSSRKSIQEEEPVFKISDSEMPQDQGNRVRQVVHVAYFINNDIEYLKGRSSSKKYTTSTTKTKAAKYDNIKGIEDMVLTESKHDVFSTKRIIAVTYVKVMKLYDYGYMEEIEVRREDQSLHKFKEDDFPRLNMCNIEDMLLHLVWKKISNLGKEIDALYKFCDGTLTSVQKVLHNIASNLRMEYLLKRRWSKLDRKRSHIMIKVIDQQLFERRLMRNLEKFVSGRAYGEDFRLLEQKI
ncbi:hypothetical protein Tco_1011688 [Tanacetum coccineum]